MRGMQFVFVSSVFFLLSMPVLSQDVRVSTEMDSTHFLIGEWMHIDVEVDAPEQATLLLPSDDEGVEHGEFVSAGDVEISAREDRSIYRQRVIVTAFDTGRIDLRLRVQYRLPDDTTLFSAYSPPISLQLGTVELDTTDTFRDIRDVLHISLTIWDYLLILAILLLLLLLLWYAYRRYRKWKDRPVVEAPPEPEPALPVHLIALQALEELRAKQLWQAGRHKEYQSEITDILRSYLERRYRIPALEQTSPETITALALHGIAPQSIEGIERMMRIADMTKFAKYQPAAMEHEDAMDVVIGFINDTAPRQQSSAGEAPPRDPNDREETYQPAGAGRKHEHVPTEDATHAEIPGTTDPSDTDDVTTGRLPGEGERKDV
jgi:hypothetical protein